MNDSLPPVKPGSIIAFLGNKLVALSSDEYEEAIFQKFKEIIESGDRKALMRILAAYKVNNDD